jgi:23S rRNA (cytidine1920-2'-O)/16S rRNA (cytidine1409-2'-O)-methyltransferase
MSGKVTLSGVVTDKPGTPVTLDAQVAVSSDRPFVGRGGLKLQKALSTFHLPVHDKICADVGCSTGGFTEVLLGSGAARVYAIDTGYGELAWKLRTDPRVVVMEKTNMLTVDRLPEPINVVTVDLSLLSLTKALPVVSGWLATEASVIALVKPQYEATRDQLPPGAVITDPALHVTILETLIPELTRLSLHPRGLTVSPITGGKGGNVEFLLWLERTPSDSFHLEEAVHQAVRDAAFIER